jgi:hypothetical protein
MLSLLVFIRLKHKIALVKDYIYNHSILLVKGGHRFEAREASVCGRKRRPELIMFANSIEAGGTDAAV